MEESKSRAEGHSPHFPWPISGEQAGPPLYSPDLPIIAERRRNVPAAHHDAPHYSARIWRYLRLEHFKHLLDEGALFLARADSFADNLEGTLSPKNRNARGHVYPRDERMRSLYPIISKEFELMKAWTFVSCWRIDEDENAQCWSKYGGRVVAVQTNYLHLSRLAGCYFCARVKYVDHQSTWIPESNSLYPFFHKDVADYEWEREFRIIDQRLPEVRVGQEIRRSCSNPCPYLGRLLRIDLGKLIHQIVISPTASSECVVEVKALAAKHGLAQRVRRSSLAN